MANKALNMRHQADVTDIIDIKGFTRTDLAYATAATQSGVINEGWYDVWSDATCYIEVSDTTTALTTSNGYRLLANNVISVKIRTGDMFAVAGGTASGTLSWHKVG